jgi:glycosyltransferase involved in cell wall biosynthesis
MRIMFVTARPPWPPRRGDQARVAGIAPRLAARHEVRIVALRPTGFAAAPPPSGVAVSEVPLPPLGQLASLLSHPGLPVQVAIHHGARLRRAVAREIAARHPDVAVVVLSRVGGVLPALGSVPAFLDLIDALELNMRNRAAREGVLAPLFRLEARRIGRWDRALVERAAAAAVVSEHDRAALVAAAPGLGDRVRVLPFGVEIPAAPLAAAAGEVVLLSGNLGYFPTVEGAAWFAREVWPRVRAVRPRAEWWLAGARPAARLRALAVLPGVRLMPAPDDLDAVRRQAAVAIAPMRSGSGTPIKVLEAMAGGVPVVATAAAAAGLDGVPADALAVATDADAFARETVRLLGDAGLARARAAAARAWVRGRHDIEVVAATLEELLDEIARRDPRAV